MNFLEEDTQGIDLTTLGLGISHKKGVMRFTSKYAITLSGMQEVLKLQKELGIECRVYKNDADQVAAGELILESFGDAGALHKAWKISQNIFEHLSAIATYTSELLSTARELNPTISIATTRKNFPGSKKLMIEAVMAGGGIAHRLGTYDSILVFAQHRAFLKKRKELESAIKELKMKFPEKKINVEVESFAEALYFSQLGVDILQCEKMAFDTLKRCVALKEKQPHLIIMATGGITLENAKEYAQTGVDVLVTSSPYHAKPKDIKVTMEALSEEIEPNAT